MTKINRSNVKRLANGALHRTNKFITKRMKLSRNEELSSSSDDDHWPILPPTSSSSSSISELSPIEEEENSSSVSTLSSSSSNYDSFLNSSITSISSISSRDSNKNQDLKGFENNQESVSGLKSTEIIAGTSKIKNENTMINIGPTEEEQTTHENAPSSSKVHRRNHSIVEEVEHLGVEILHSSISHISEIESYHQTKNFAFLLLNMALLSSNGNQMKYLLESPNERSIITFSIAFIGISIFFQIIAKIFSLLSYRHNLNSVEGATKLKHLNVFLVIFTLIITFMNISISMLILFDIFGFIPT